MPIREIRLIRGFSDLVAQQRTRFNGLNMDTPLTLLVIGLPLVMLGVAAWPFLLLPRVRTVLVGAGGTCCVACGTLVAGLLAAGMLPLPGFTQSTAVAQDETPAAKPADSSSAASESARDEATANPAVEIVPQPPAATITAPATPASSTPAPAATTSTPVPPIEVSPPIPGQENDAKHDDIKIETRPDGTVIIPAGRPDWVEREPSFVGDVHRIPVASGHYKRPLDVKHALDEEIVKATEDYIAEILNSKLAPSLLRYDARTIRSRFVGPSNVYDEVITFREPLEEMHQSHVLLEFGPEFRKELESSWVGKIAESRLLQMSLVAGGAILLLGSVFGYFRLDNATRGYYTGRLQFMTAAAILAIVALGAAAAFRFTWL
jgi:hypothetical protein